jgi:hypothetical protein
MIYLLNMVILQFAMRSIIFVGRLCRRGAIDALQVKGVGDLHVAHLVSG